MCKHLHPTAELQHTDFLTRVVGFLCFQSIKGEKDAAGGGAAGESSVPGEDPDLVGVDDDDGGDVSRYDDGMLGPSSIGS